MMKLCYALASILGSVVILMGSLVPVAGQHSAATSGVVPVITLALQDRGSQADRQLKADIQRALALSPTVKSVPGPV